MDRKRFMLIGILLLSLVGFYVVENVIESSNDVESEVVSSEEVELTVPGKILAEAKKFEETGEGKNLPGMVSALSDYEFEKACDWATEECVEMCEGLDDWRCESICYNDFSTNEPCRAWLLNEIEEVGFLKAINEGYYSKSMFSYPDRFVRVGEGYPHPNIGERFLGEMKMWSQEDLERWEVSTTAEIFGVSLREHGLGIGDIKEFYAAFEPFGEDQFLTDLVIITNNDEMYWMNTPIPEVLDVKKFTLKRVM